MNCYHISLIHSPVYWPNVTFKIEIIIYDG